MWANSRKRGDVLHDHVSKACPRLAYQLYVNNNVGTKGEGRREPYSCSLNEADQSARFTSIGGYWNVINNSNRVLLTQLYTKVFYISRRILLLI